MRSLPLNHAQAQASLELARRLSGMAPRQLIIGQRSDVACRPAGCGRAGVSTGRGLPSAEGAEAQKSFFEKLLVVRGLVALTVGIGHRAWS